MGRLTGGDPSLLRRINSAVVLHALRATDCATLTEITRVTGLSRPTVEGVVEGLIESGLVVEKAADESVARRQGRPARRFRFRAEAGHLLGLEIGPHRVAALLSDLDGRVLGAVRQGRRRDGVRRRAAGAAADRGRRPAAPGRGRARARCGRSGSAARASWRRTARCGWARRCPSGRGCRSASGCSRSFKCPVLVENDANAAAVAEHWKGAATESDDVVFVLAGLSPGAGSLIGGRLHRGLRRGGRRDRRAASAGPRGHPGDAAVHHGRAAAPARRAGGRRGLRAGPGGRRSGPRAAVDRFIQRLVHDVAALVLALDPELVVVGGWAAGLDGVLEPLRRELARYCLRPPQVALSLLGEAAVATGALRLALDHVEEQLFAVEGTVTARR